MASTIPLAQFIFARLKRLHCHSIHGVPGDFMLQALDFLPAAQVRWIGNVNELCAGYAADGYCRAAHFTKKWNHSPVEGPKVGAVFTTYGVGELSAINAVAGSFAESVPVVHLVGTPSRRQWRTGACIHHTLGDGNVGIYAEMASRITCAQADLGHDDARDAAKAYDEALIECVRRSKPVYVNLPSDVISSPVPADLLDTPLDLQPSANDTVEEEQVLSTILSRIQEARRPLIIADGLSYPWNFSAELNDVSQLTGIRTTCYSAGKGIVDESSPRWIGPLTGLTQLSQMTDLALLFGPLLSDTNTAAWTAVPDPGVCVSFGLDRITIGSYVHHVRSKPLLEKLVCRLRRLTDPMRTAEEKPATPSKRLPQRPPRSSPINQDDFWNRMSSWLKPYDTLLLANGTPLIGGRDMHLPTPTHVIASGIWCSIGQMLPGAQGVAAAKRDLALPGRTILFEGDGSFQVTCQSLSDIIRHRLDVTVFLVNNAGYAYERCLNGMEAEYNDVAAWRYAEAAGFFGAAGDDPQYPVISRPVRTWGELEDVLSDPKIAATRGIKLIDITMGPADVPSAARPGLQRAGVTLKAS